jgi:hypothetical protein
LPPFHARPPITKLLALYALYVKRSENAGNFFPVSVVAEDCAVYFPTERKKNFKMLSQADFRY